MLNDLSKYLVEDKQKQELINDLFIPKLSLKSIRNEYSENCYIDMDAAHADEGEFTKYCPKCNKRFHEKSNFCPDCLCTLKYIDSRVNIKDISINPVFEYAGSNDYHGFDEIFTDENLARINDFKFSTIDFQDITTNIKRTALQNMDNIINIFDLDLKTLKTDEKILLFAKSFVNVEFKSYGQELGHFEFNKITVDERLLPSLYTTTLIHELSHFLLKEIIAETLSKLLNASKNTLIDAISVFILSYDPFTQLIDEYSAHSVEGRFTIYGYQDYSSFLSILKSLEGEKTTDEIEITKSIANTFASHITEILETFIDDELRRDIKEEFRRDNFEKPNYEMLALENSNCLTDEGFMKAIWLVVSEGFEVAASNIGKLGDYQKRF